MQNFEYYNPTRLIFGRGEIASLTRHIPEGVRVLVTFGGGSVKRNGVYDQVKAALAGIDHVEFWGIEANPKVETLRKCIEFGREQKAGFILAVGGGSVLDGSKLVACALTEGETRDAWDIVLSRRPARCIPYASVMTLPATGSEMNALTGMAHGATLAIVFPALLRVLIDTKEAKLVQMGERVFDVHYGTDRERALETIVRLEAFFASLGLPTRLDEAGVGEDVEREIVRRFEERNWKLGEHKNITPAQIAAILASARPTKARG